MAETGMSGTICNIVPRADGQSQPRYRIQKQIGVGGMATVYLAEEVESGRRVAIKYPHAEKIDASTEFFDRFVREAQLARSIRHPNVIQIQDLGIDDGNQPFMVMEYVEGAETLADIIERANGDFYAQGTAEKIRGSLLPFEETLDYFRQILDGLEAIHAARIIHRDLKPENILVTQRGGKRHLLIMDFGVAKNLRPRPEEPDLTKNMVVGTPNYLSPEHIRVRFDAEGKPWRVGEYSDIWSALIILYEMISGQVPFTHASLELLMGLIVDESPRGRAIPIETYVQEVNPAFAYLFHVGFTKLPWERPQSVQAVRELLEMVEVAARIQHMPSPPISANLPAASRHQTEPTFPVARQRARSSKAWTLMAVILMGMAAVLLWNVWQERSARGIMTEAPAVGSAALSAMVEPISSVGQEVKAHKRTPRAAPSESDPREKEDARRYRQAAEAMAKGNCTVAERISSYLLSVYPAFPKPLEMLGDCARKRKPAKAREYYRRYLEFEGSTLSPEKQEFLEREQ